MSEPKPLTYARPDKPAAGRDDLHYLRVLVICHAAFGLLHMSVGALMLDDVDATIRERTIEILLVAGGLLCCVAALFLLLRRHGWFVYAVSALMLISIPFGTIIGAYTIGVLRRPGVAVLFRRRQ